MKPYNELSPFIKGLVDEFLEYAIPTGIPIDELLSTNVETRDMIRAAEGLLYRNNPGDVDKASKIIEFVLSQQFKNRFHLITGSWKTSSINSRMDANWREFIGCELIIIYENYRNLLPKKISELLLLGLQLAALNSKSRNVSPYYTNIAAMSAILMEYAGRKFKIFPLENAGLQKANNLFEIYFKNQTFSEFNSPTYAGTTEIAFALWRKYGSPKLAKLGKLMEEELWQQIADYYNFNLKNICGPYIRSYGMDMEKYSSIIGLWLAVILDNKEIAPYPDFENKKYSEISNIIPIVHLEPDLPEKAMREFTGFTQERFREGTIVRHWFSTGIKFEMSINENWMMGGLRRDLKNWSQIKIGTFHWIDSNTGKIYWLLVPGEGKADVVVTKMNFSIFAKWFQKSIRFFIQGSDLREEMFTERQWNLPGFLFKVYTHKSEISMQKIDDIENFREQWAVGDVVENVFEFTCKFRRKLIRQQAITIEPILEK